MNEEKAVREFMTRLNLFGNVEFVGELYKKTIIPNKILQLVFTGLLDFQY